MTALPRGIKADITAPVRDAFARDGEVGTGPAPRAVLYPSNIHEVRKVVVWANETRTALIPVSSTGLRRRGDTVPLTDGAVVVDLSGMTKLIHADPRDKIAIIEAGVDFGSIDEILRPHGLRAFRPLMPRAGKSVIASYLDREPIINADVHWDPADPFGGTAIISGGGELTLNGSAALEGTLKEQLERGHRHMVTFGPGNVDLTRVLQGSQGSLGVMGWAAIYCERLPKVEDSLFLCSETPSAVLAAMREAVHRRICTTAFVVDRVQLAMLLGLEMDAAAMLPAWTFFATQAGYVHAPERKVAWQRSDLEEVAARHGARLEKTLLGTSADALADRLRQSPRVCYRDVPFGAHKELFFLHPISSVERMLDIQEAHLRTGALAARPVGTYIQPLAQGTFAHVERVMPHGPDADVGADWRSLAEASLRAGAFYSRPHGVARDLAFLRDDGSAARMIGAAKALLDPCNVMNPNRFVVQEAIG
ncbi:FAD-binding protein [Rhizobium sp. CSW-27]|uniref:FAD-binding oxidoreductase n=1 Tax=Rhizobium sp. CSW-27 TaxID=2839985 RepID=UPI001C037935|nr:FAD-binding protein [Rhizobium sp. CSW-27]MBT9370848.1 FAD-binding protein [Rhizobium sp. CSW-27]